MSLFSLDSAMDDRVVVRRPVGPPPLALRMVAVLAVPLLLYALVVTGQKALTNYQMHQQEQQLAAHVQELQAENVQLQENIVDAHTDAQIEKIAREQLGLVDPGDHALAIAAGGDPVTPKATPPPVAPPASPPVQAWWSYFFGG